VTTPKEVLRARLAARARASDGDLAERATRVVRAVDDLGPVIVIENVGTPEEGGARLTAALRRT
jgi:ribose 1,5-bisphosphokinase